MTPLALDHLTLRHGECPVVKGAAPRAGARFGPRPAGRASPRRAVALHGDVPGRIAAPTAPHPNRRAGSRMAEVAR